MRRRWICRVYFCHGGGRRHFDDRVEFEGLGEVEQESSAPACTRDDEIVEGVMMWDNDVVLDEDQLIDGCSFQFIEHVLSTKNFQCFGQKHLHGHTLLDSKGTAMS